MAILEQPKTVASQSASIPLNRKPKRSGWSWLVLALLILVGVAILAPLGLMLLNAFKSPNDYSTGGPMLLPEKLYFDGLITYWEASDFPRKLWNSTFISTISAVISVGLSFLTAYAIGVGKVRGSKAMILFFLTATMLPHEALVYPLVTMFKDVGLYNNLWSVTLIQGVIHMAFGTYLLSSVMGTLPKAILEAAAIDGAGRFRVLCQVVLPLVKNSLAVLMVFFFIWTWNDFFISLVMLVSNDVQTVPLALALLQDDQMMDVPTTNAATLISIIPALIFFLIFQRTLTKGVAVGAVK